MNALKAPVAIVICACLLLSGRTFAVEASVSATIAPQQHKTIRLKNLPAAASLEVDINSNGKLTATLYHEAELRKTAGKRRSLFNSKFDRHIAFSLKLDTAGHYYLILSNASQSQSVTAQVAFVAERDPAVTRAQTTLLKFEYALFKLIDFQKFPIAIIGCNKPGLSQHARQTVLCKEHIKFSALLLKERDAASDYLLYSLLHLAGHHILAQWGVDATDEQLVNEFTVSMLLLLNRHAQARGVLTELINQYPTQQLIDTANFARYHIPDADQLAELTALLNRRSLSTRWQAIFIPRIRTELLEKLAAQQVSWLDATAIQKELASRKLTTDHPQEKIRF